MLFFKTNRLFYNFFSLGSVQLINSLLQLMVIPYVIARIGADGFGVVAVAQVVMLYLSSLTEYGFGQTATRELTRVHTDATSTSALFFRVLFSRLLLCVIAFLILLLLIAFIPLFREHARLYLMAFVFVTGQAILLTWFFQGVERMQFIAFATLIARIIFVVLVFSFIKGRQDGYLFLFFLGAGNLVAGLLSVYVALRFFRISFVRPSWAGVIMELKNGWPIMVSNLSINTCQYANLFILRIFSSDLITGYYSIAERIFFTIRQLLGVFSQAIYPQVCRLARLSREEVNRFFRSVYWPFFVAVFGGCVLLFVLSPWVLAFFLGQEGVHAVPVLRLFCIASVFIYLNIPGSLLLLANDRRKPYFRVFLIATLLNISCNFLLAPRFGATGTAISVLITEFFIATGLTLQLRHRGAGERGGGDAPGFIG